MNVATPESVGLLSERLDRIRPVLQSYIDHHIIAGAITVVARHGKVAYRECLGMMDAEASKPMREDAIFRIYSMTKPITSTALMMLVEQGRLLLSDPLAKYLPAFKDIRVYTGRDVTGGIITTPAERLITVHDLLIHTAGLGYGLFDDHPIEDLFRASGIFSPILRLQVGLDEMATRIAALPLANQPGARFRYSIATDLLGYLVQLIADMPFDVYLAEKIFRPLGMNDTGFFVPSNKVERLCACYQPDAENRYVLIDSPTTSAWLRADVAPSGGAGLVSTAADYLRFGQMLLNGGELDGVRIVGRKTLSLMTTNHLPASLLPPLVGADAQPGDGFGLGFNMRTGNEAGTLGSIGMYGWDGAADTRFRVDPAEDLVYLYMAQSYFGAEPIATVCQNLVYQSIVD
ncbi:MAG: beta-lactamase family protein [Chloroflexi bacterium]|nr:beta-lactamase family protein [Chloroflexota bacterium]